MNDIKDVVSGKITSGYTNIELRTICINPSFFTNTEFYLNNKRLDPTEVENLGITLQKVD